MFKISAFLISDTKTIFIKLLLVSNLFITETESFIHCKNYNSISNFSNTHFNSDGVYDSNNSSFKCSNIFNSSEDTHLINEVESNEKSLDDFQNKNDKNILALLCSKEKKYDILKCICYSIDSKDDKNKRVLYLTSDPDLEYTHNILSNTIGKEKVNIIDPNLVIIHRNSLITLANFKILQNYYNLLNNNVIFKEPDKIKSDDIDVSESDITEFHSEIRSILSPYFMSNDEISSESFTPQPKIELDEEFLVSSKEWISNNFFEPEDFIKFINGIEKQNVVILDDFTLNYDAQSNTLKSTLNDDIVALLKKDCLFAGISDVLYNPQNVVNWLEALFGHVKVVTMSKTPNFNLLTSYGSYEPFTNQPENYARSFSRTDKSDPREKYKYVKKKSNLVKLTNINPELDEVVVKIIIDALKSIGVDSYHKILRVSPKVYDLLKNYSKVLRRSPDFMNSSDKLYDLLRSIVDIANNKILSRLIRKIKLDPIINLQQSPNSETIVNFVKEKNLYPTVLYKFNSDLGIILNEFYHLILSNNSLLEYEDIQYDFPFLDQTRKYLLKYGICMVSKTDPDEYKSFVEQNAKKFKIILTDHRMPSASHYIFLDSYIRSQDRWLSFGNDTIYSLTQGADLVTFTFDIIQFLHILKSLVSPIYMNFNRLEHKEPEFHNHKDFLSQMLFRSHLKACRDLYSQKFPDHINVHYSYMQLKHELESHNLDTFELNRLNKKIRDFEKNVRTIEYTLVSRLRFRSMMMVKILTNLGDVDPIVIGIDDRKYFLLEDTRMPIQYFEFKHLDLMARFKDALSDGDISYVLLKDVENQNYILTKYIFVKDVSSIGEERSNVRKKIGVNDLFTSEIIVENDLKENMDINEKRIRIVSINGMYEACNKNLSTMIPSKLTEWINKTFESYENDRKLYLSTIEKAINQVKTVNPLNEDLKQRIDSLVREFERLGKISKKANLEQVIGNYRFRNSFWGS